MKKKTLFLLTLVFLVISCATHPKDFEKKIGAGDYIDAVFEYPWEQVYNAIAFVWRHSEDPLIAIRYKFIFWDYAREEKMMLGREKESNPAYLVMGIYCEPQEESKTRVMFVQGSTFGGEIGRTRIERIIDESNFYLKNGEEAYRKYTHEESLSNKRLYKSRGWIP